MVGVFCQWMSIISFREYLKMFMKYGIERMNIVMEGNYVIIKWVKVFQKPSWKTADNNWKEIRNKNAYRYYH